MGRKEKLIKKQQAQVDHKGKSRIWIKIGAGALLATAVSLGTIEYLSQRKENNIEQKAQDDFEEAKKHPKKRQAYLDKIFEKGKIPYCAAVVYDEDGSKITEYIKEEIRAFGETPKERDLNPFKNMFRGGNYEAKTPEVFQLSGKGKSAKIFLGRKHFEESHLTIEDLRHIIEAHEGRHTYQHGKGLDLMHTEKIVEGYTRGLIDYLVLYEIGELDANFYGIKAIQSGKYKVSKNHHDVTKWNYNLNRSRLESIQGKGSPIQNELVRKALEKLGNAER